MKFTIRWRLVLYDILILALVDWLLLLFYTAPPVLTYRDIILHAAVSFVCIFAARSIGGVYKRVWRYGDIQSYIRLLIADAVAFWMACLIELSIPVLSPIVFSRLLSGACMALLGSLTIRMLYRYAYKYRNR